MPKQQAFNLGRTLTVIALIGCLTSSAWVLLPGIIGFSLVWYGSTE